MFLKRFVLFLIFIPCCAISSPRYDVNKLLYKATELNLSVNPVWYKLLSYEQNFNSSVQSTVQQRSYFISEEGKTNSKAELEATLRAFFLPIAEDVNKHAVCQFPARYLWLKKQLKLSEKSLPVIKCLDFQKWTAGNSIQSVSIVFASGYMGNPGSYYGHVLLKLNSGKSTNKSHLLDQTVNYGVIASDGDNPLSYMVKGVFGGYDGGFSRINYDFHNKNYGEIELRDMWEYELALSQNEVDFVVAHAWEVLDKTHKYFFFKENCVTRLAELLEVIDGVNVVPDNPVFVLPQALIKELASFHRNGEDFIRSIKFHPSRQTELYAKYSSLSNLQQDFVHNIVLDIEGLESAPFMSLDEESQKVILATLLDYFEYAKSIDKLSDVERKIYQQKVLSKRFELTPGEHSVEIKKNYPPHSSHEASYIQIGLASNQKHGEGFIFKLRPAYYDTLDADHGFPANSSLSMGTISIQVFGGKAKVREFNIVRIESVNSAITGLPGDDGGSWKFTLGLVSQNLSCSNCLTARLEADYGWTVRPDPKLLMGAYIGGIVQDNREGSGNVLLKSTAFMNATLSEKVNARVLIELPKRIDGSKEAGEKMLFETRYRLGLNSDIRFLYQKQKASEFTFSLGYYF